MLAPILVLLACLGVWSGHFESSFHLDDLHTVVHNSALYSASNVPRYFVDPRLSADDPDFTYYAPLLTAAFTLDYHVTGSAAVTVFQIDSFAWFLLDVIAAYLLFLLLSGSDQRTALLGAGIFALHPVAAETVNYVSRRGSIMGALGLLLGLSVWILWSKYLPAQLFRFDAVPKTGWDEFRRIWYPRFEAWYQKFIKLPLGLYLIPAVLAMLSDPTAAVFAPLLLVYLLLFDRDRVSRRVLPAAAVCGGYWLFQLIFTWRLGGLRLPFFSYLGAQPLVVVRYFCTFFVPVHLSAVGGITALVQPWSPLALAGDAGFAGIVWLAVATARRQGFQSVSFGIWWFLICLAPTSLVPQSAFEDDQRMYVAMVGLAFSAARVIWMAIDRASELPSRRTASLVGGTVLIVILLAGCSWATFARNQVWNSEIRLWEDATLKSPENPTGFIRYANALIAVGATDAAYENLGKASNLTHEDPAGFVALARAFDALGKVADTERSFRLAVASGAHYAPAFSYYAQWLQVQGRLGDSLAMAKRALEIDPRNLAARHTLMDIYSAENNWSEVKRVAEETLRVEPGDMASTRAMGLAQSVFDGVLKAERKAQNAVSVDDYLALSVAYFEARRFEDSIRACRQALGMRPDLPEAYSNMAAAEYQLGRLDETEAALRQALRLRPDLAVAKKNLDFILSLKGQSKAATK